VAGFIVSEAAGRPHHWRSESSLATFLAKWGVVGIGGVDTRRLVRHLRTHGLQRGVLSIEDLSDAELVARARSLPEIGTLDLVGEVSIRERQHHPGRGSRVAVLDCGLKWGILDNLRQRGCDTWVLPHTATA
jgi:carbamoyl-phosphate synthase small subunit